MKSTKSWLRGERKAQTGEPVFLLNLRPLCPWRYFPIQEEHHWEVEKGFSQHQRLMKQGVGWRCCQGLRGRQWASLALSGNLEGWILAVRVRYKESVSFKYYSSPLNQGNSWNYIEMFPDSYCSQASGRSKPQIILQNSLLIQFPEPSKIF